jgi:hypothetical protein
MFVAGGDTAKDNVIGDGPHTLSVRLKIHYMNDLGRDAD